MSGQGRRLGRVGATPWVIEPGDGHAYLESVIRSVAILARRVAGLPDCLARGLAVLALLVLAATALVTAPAPVRAAVVDGPACSIASSSVAFLSGLRDPAPEAGRSVFDRTDLCAADIEILTELGLPRPPVDAPRLRHTVSATFRHTSESLPLSVPDGSPHRPPRLA